VTASRFRPSAFTTGEPDDDSLTAKNRHNNDHPPTTLFLAYLQFPWNDNPTIIGRMNDEKTQRHIHKQLSTGAAATTTLIWSHETS
jgi:hypothetical protein